MFISFNWVRDFVKGIPDDVNPDDLVDNITRTTAEIDGFTLIKAPDPRIIIVKILKITRHPNADKLSLVTVSTGKATLPQIVCGAQNIKEDYLVPLAQTGVTLEKDGEPMEIKQALIRGQESNGMLCSELELGLGSDHSGILLLPDSAEKFLGSSLSDFMGLTDDIILEMDNKALSNRPDLTGHLGFAREVFCMFKERLGKNVKFTGPRFTKIPDKLPGFQIEIKDAGKCKRYTALGFSGVKIKESPAWLASRLRALGQNSINSIVDITNYIAFELGQPLHGFDRTKITGDKIIVRKASSGESLQLLDGNTIKLHEEDLLICDAEKPLVLAGVMGGEFSKIEQSSTSRILFELANFEQIGIRRTDMRHTLRTESSIRFEKGIHPDLIDTALGLLMSLMKEIHPEATPECFGDKYPGKSPLNKISCKPSDILRKLGINVEPAKIKSVLELLGCKASVTKDKAEILVPFWRTKDLTSPDELSEEIARFHGLDNFPIEAPRAQIIPAEVDPIFTIEEIIRSSLADSGGIEIMNRPFTTKQKLADAGLSEEPAISVDNPVSQEATHLRYSLIPGLLEVLGDNVKRTGLPFSVFEIGNIYLKDDQGYFFDTKTDLPYEKRLLGIACTGPAKGMSPLNNSVTKLKFLLDKLGRRLNVKFDFPASQDKSADNVLDVVYHHKKLQLGSISTPNQAILSGYGLEDQHVALMVMDLRILLELYSSAFKAVTVSTFPEVSRDLSVFLPQNVSWMDIKNIILRSSPLIMNTEPWDLYEKSGQSTLTFSYSLQSKVKTLEDSEITDVFNTIIKDLSTLGVKLTAPV